jgi:hypothetical protein
LGTIPDGWPAIQAANQFNEPPNPGVQYHITEVQLTNNGAEEESAAFALSFSSVDSANVEYQDTLGSSCGVLPNELPFTDVFQGGTVVGQVCSPVDPTRLDTLVLIVEPSFEFDSEKTFFALR